MPTIIHCSHCQRQLQVLEASLGQRVQCPFCTAIFIAQAPPGNEPPPPQELPEPTQGQLTSDTPPDQGFLPVPEDDQGEILHGWAHRIERQKKVRPLITPPALALLATGVLGVIANAFFVLRTLVLFANAAEGSPTSADRGLLAFVAFTGCVFLSGVVIYGASEMLAMRSSYIMAVGTSVLAMLIVCPGCFLVGVPVGIWAIRTLKQADVKSAFG